MFIAALAGQSTEADQLHKGRISDMWSTHTIEHYSVLQKEIQTHAATWVNPKTLLSVE
jgi:hypothetical protein